MAERMRIQRWVIQWNHGAYRQPPDDLPSILAEQCILVPATWGARFPPELEKLYDEHKPPLGYGIHFGVLEEASKRTLSQEGKGKLRKSKLHSRLQKKVPLFADQLEAQELEAKPDYYAGKISAAQERFIQECAQEHQKALEAARQNIGLRIYYQWW